MIGLPELINAFRRARAAGLTDAQIQDQALAAGWSMHDIDAAFLAVNEPGQEMVPDVIPTHLAEPSPVPVALLEEHKGIIPLKLEAPETHALLTPPHAWWQRPCAQNALSMATVVLLIAIAYAAAVHWGPFGMIEDAIRRVLWLL